MHYSSRYPLSVALATLGSSIVTTAAIAQDNDSTVLEEITVTAQRREEKLSDVPLSISAYSQDKMDAQGVRNIDDIARLTPGVTFSRGDARNGQAANISIRGIASNAGAATTGLYIDDTPIQIRTLGYSSFNTFPAVFDVERVEVLRGPQGTLFGAGSEGGTVRFITPSPSFNKTSAYVRSEFSNTQDGDPSGELGAAVGGPISDTLAYRVSGWFRRDGGTVNRVDFDRATRTPTTTLDENANWQNSVVAKAALTYAPTENLRITPSIYYQETKLNDASFYWVPLSSGDDLNSGNAVQAKSEDRFYLPALKVEWNLGPASLVSNTSYFNRRNEAVNDYTAFEAGIWAANPYYPVGMFAPAFQQNWQNNLTQELRLQGGDADTRFNWVVGAFYSHSRQTASQFVQDTFLPALFQQATGVPFQVAFGQGLVDGLYTAVNAPIISRDDQKALFGQADYKATEKLTLTLGLRVSKTEVEASGRFRGPVVGPEVNDTGSQSESPVTPKAGVSYKLNPDNMLYATAAKGFRIGGYNPRVGLPCNAQLASLGLSGTPSLYSSDSVWSYEAGSKNSLLEGRLQVNSSIYFIDWSNIQQNVGLGSCGFQFTANLGSATSKGADIQLEVEPIDDLSVGLSVGYTNAKYDETIKGGPTAATSIVTKGDHIVGSPWTGALSAQYRFSAFGDRTAYARTDYQYQAKQTDLVAANNPSNGTFQPANVFVQPQTDLLSVRAGVEVSRGLDVSLFVNNLLDSDTVIARTATPGPVLLQQGATFRPRTYGLTATFRY